jgi:hypothetical protein
MYDERNHEQKNNPNKTTENNRYHEVALLIR